MANQRKLLAIALCGIMLMSAGCAGWGTDGPVDQNDPTSNDTDELEDEQNESDDTAGDSSSDDGGSGDTAEDSDGAGTDTDDPDGDSADGTDDGSSDDDSGSSDDESDSTTDDDSDDEQSNDGANDDESNGSTGGTEDGDASDNATDDDANDDDQGDGEGSDEHTITISVVDQDGAPVTDGAVALMGPDAGILGDQEIDENGQVQFTVREEGTYSYNVYDADGYEEVADDQSFDVNDDVDLTVELEATQQYAASSEVAIEGVEWATEENGAEQDYVVLRNTNESVPLDTSGWEIYTDVEETTVPLGVDEIGPGESVTVSAMLDGMYGGLITVYDGEDTEVTSANYDEHPEWGDSGPSTLRVETADANGEGVSNASVTLTQSDSDTEYTASADENGTATIDQLPAGEYDVEVAADGYESTTESVVLEDGENRTLQVELTGANDGSERLQVDSVGVTA